MDIYLTSNHLPDFYFISLISESETNVKLHPKLKLTNILKFKRALFVTVGLNYLTLCEGLGLDQTDLVLFFENFCKSWS